MNFCLNFLVILLKQTRSSTLKPLSLFKSRLPTVSSPTDQERIRYNIFCRFIRCSKHVGVSYDNSRWRWVSSVVVVDTQFVRWPPVSVGWRSVDDDGWFVRFLLMTYVRVSLSCDLRNTASLVSTYQEFLKLDWFVRMAIVN